MNRMGPDFETPFFLGYGSDKVRSARKALVEHDRVRLRIRYDKSNPRSDVASLSTKATLKKSTYPAIMEVSAPTTKESAVRVPCCISH
eukprot:1194896-Prorocentrum_minimum.AAC.3